MGGFGEKDQNQYQRVIQSTSKKNRACSITTRLYFSITEFKTYLYLLANKTIFHHFKEYYIMSVIFCLVYLIKPISSQCTYTIFKLRVLCVCHLTVIISSEQITPSNVAPSANFFYFLLSCISQFTIVSAIDLSNFFLYTKRKMNKILLKN